MLIMLCYGEMLAAIRLRIKSGAYYCSCSLYTAQVFRTFRVP